MRIIMLCYRKVRDFPVALRVRKVSGAFEKRAPGSDNILCIRENVKVTADKVKNMDFYHQAILSSVSAELIDVR